MGTSLGTSRNDWKQETATGATAFGSGFMETASEPATNVTNGVYLLGVNTPFPAGSDFDNISALFTASGTANKTASGRIWGVNKVAANKYLGVVLGELKLTSGSVSYLGGLNVKSVAVNIDVSNQPPGIRVIGDSGDRSAGILIDAMGFQFIVLELINDSGGTTTIGVIWRQL